MAELVAGEVVCFALAELRPAGEVLGSCTLLLIAGNETTTNLLGNALLCLAERPEIREQLRATPILLPQAIEEVLRFRSPVQSMFRVSTKQVRLHEQIIPAGASVVAWIGSANHDETHFERPETFDIERQPNRHLAFGYGIHFCLGAPLARLEARIALGALLERIGRVRLEPNVELEPLQSSIVYGVRHLPVTFERPTRAV